VRLATRGRTGLEPPRLVVPAYFHPALRPEDWSWLVEHADQVRLVILNLASGPGGRPDELFLAVSRRLRAAGVCVAGYVDTDYGRRQWQTAAAEIARYVEWFEVDGVFFDQVATGAAQVGHFAELSHHARSTGLQTVVFNHGTHPVEEYAAHADILGTFEGPWHAYVGLAVPRWTRSLPPDRFYHVVYAVPPDRLGKARVLASRRRAGNAYLTDAGGGNPYDRLPAGFVDPQAS
jgi:hypothetical protein